MPAAKPGHAGSSEATAQRLRVGLAGEPEISGRDRGPAVGGDVPHAASLGPGVTFLVNFAMTVLSAASDVE